MRIKFNAFLLTAMLCLALPAQAKTVPALFLEQRSMVYGTSVSLVVSADKFRWSNPKTGIVLVGSRDKQNVTICNSRTKACFASTFQKFKGNMSDFFYFFRANAPTDIPLKHASSEEKGGLTFSHYVLDSDAERKSAEPRFHRSKFRTKEALYDLVQDKSVNNAIADFVAKIYDLPQLNGLPYSYSYRQLSGKQFLLLETSACKRANVSEEQFLPPPGLHFVKTEKEAFDSPDAENGVKDLVDGFNSKW
jgi:hypothetical protein